MKQCGALCAGAKRPAIRGIAKVAGHHFHAAHGAQFRTVLFGQNQAANFRVARKAAQGGMGKIACGQQARQALSQPAE
jgi:hypothetical protein